MVPWYSVPAAPAPPTNDEAEADFYFEGPEKKLEVVFSAPPDAAGFRIFAPAVWSDVLAEAHCSILHTVGNESFDSYLLSESSLFVYPHKLILKTCGTTTLLLTLPKIQKLAKQLRCCLSHVHYSHFRFGQPQLQPYPHSSFTEEQDTLATLLRGDLAAPPTARALGGPADDDTAARWYALCAEGLPAAPLAELSAPAGVEPEPDVIELAMEGLPLGVCHAFFGESHAPLAGRELARRMTYVSGVGELMRDGTHIDDWAFSPCGYSMNALRGPYYYTIHVTPEPGFSFASFETNDPEYATDEAVHAVLQVFEPSRCTVTLTSRRHVDSDVPPCAPFQSPPSAYGVVADWDTSRLSRHVGVSAVSYIRLPSPGPGGPTDGAILLEDAAMSSADSESTAPLDAGSDAASDKDVGSEGGSAEAESSEGEVGGDKDEAAPRVVRKSVKDAAAKAAAAIRAA